MITKLSQQLSFEFSSLLQTSNDTFMLYKIEALKSTDTDYQFLLRSINCKKSQENLHIFRINLVEQNKVRKCFRQNAPLYLHGVEANKVNNLLNSGYPIDWNREQ